MFSDHSDQIVNGYLLTFPPTKAHSMIESEEDLDLKPYLDITFK